MEKLTDIQRFKIARIKFDDSLDDVGEKFGYSGRYILEVLKYPNKNKKLFKKIDNYINSSENKVQPTTA